MSKPVTVIDDMVFGRDPRYILPLLNQSDWISQIDAAGGFEEYRSLTSAATNLQNVIYEIFTQDIPQGDKRNKLLVHYDSRLLEALADGYPYTKPDDKGMFDSYLDIELKSKLPGISNRVSVALDTCFLINTYGNMERYFGKHLQELTWLERIAQKYTSYKNWTVDHTVVAAAMTTTDYATAMRDGLVEISPEHRDRLLATAEVIRNVGIAAGELESAAILDQAMEKLANAPTLQIAAPGI